jgi:peptidoglycan hydrolase CwlO-like protein
MISDKEAETVLGLDGHWHLDKRVNISLIGAVILQAILFGTLYGMLRATVERNTTDIQLMVNVQHQVIRIEESVKHMKEDIGRMTNAVQELTAELKEQRKEHYGE